MSLINGLDTEQLMKTVESIKQDWECGRTTWKATARWRNGFRVETASRGHSIGADEPEWLGGTNAAANPVELVLQAYGACLAIGYAMNAAVRGIVLRELRIDLEGEIDLPGFMGLEPPKDLNMAQLPGYKSVTAKVAIRADADPAAVKDLHRHVVATSPVGITLARPVQVRTELDVLQERSAA